ncbi:zinc finger protein with KRAB and SCAN domains 3-like [Anopheles albimanus]|uniref:zinc finger protein with KRAB and SCAN domains 3-like n=1 Tax=Anopheles albimanus TaxID=7167 RepID=UPI00163FD1F6|nr:zinc finger protein with KRAB and SCAN domains 3-like [Anopheles albimanus]
MEFSITNDSCRVCLRKTVNGQLLAGTLSTTIAKNRTLDELFRACTGFGQPGPEKLPPQASGFYPLRICPTCEQLLLAAYEFHIKSIKSEKVLQNILLLYDEDNEEVELLQQGLGYPSNSGERSPQRTSENDGRESKCKSVVIGPESVGNTTVEQVEEMVWMVDDGVALPQDATRPDVTLKSQLDLIPDVPTTLITTNTGTRQVPDTGEANTETEEGFNNIADYFMSEHDTEVLVEYTQETDAGDNEEEVDQENTRKNASTEEEATEDENIEGEYSETANHNDAQDAKPSKSNPFVCELCGARFTLSENLTKHRRIHDDDRRYECEHCGERFLHWAARRYHIARVHTKEKRYACEHCGKRFRQSSHYIIHVRGHTGHLPYVCEQCSRGFKTAESLKLHQKAHTDRKEYRCDQCHKLYKTLKSLSVHQKTHRNQRDYVCQVCERAFTQNHALRSHHMKKHPEYELPPPGTVVNATAIRRLERENGQQHRVESGFEI